MFRKSPVPLGVRDGRLADCPNSPNCVSTRAADEAHRIAPLTYSGDAAAAWEQLRTVIAAQPRARVVTATDSYLHAEFRSLVFRFVDDVEFLLDPGAGAIHFRSASRVGYSDFGVNRRRMERIRRAFDGIR
jgi:uncharacterized protein (DUF1499 family)